VFRQASLQVVSKSVNERRKHLLTGKAVRSTPSLLHPRLRVFWNAAAWGKCAIGQASIGINQSINQKLLVTRAASCTEVESEADNLTRNDMRNKVVNTRFCDYLVSECRPDIIVM